VVDTTRGAPSGLAGEIMAIAPTAMRTMLHAARRPFKDASE
jgi:hypothetical protein